MCMFVAVDLLMIASELHFCNREVHVMNLIIIVVRVQCIGLFYLMTIQRDGGQISYLCHVDILIVPPTPSLCVHKME